MQNGKPGAQLPFEDVNNLRDLGGWEAGEGRRVKYGCFFRGPQLSCIHTEKDKALFDSLGIRTVMDFRSGMERTKRPDRVAEGVSLIEMSAIVDANGLEINFDPDHTLELLGTESMERVFQDMDLYYCRMPFHNPAYRRFFTEIREGNLPIYFHCSAGKDRTGVAAVLLLMMLGVSQEDAVEDFLLTNEYRAHLLEPVRAKLSEEVLANPRCDEFIKMTVGVRKDLLDRSLLAIKRVYGGIGPYLKAEFGIDQIERHRLQRLYTEEV